MSRLAQLGPCRRSDRRRLRHGSVDLRGGPVMVLVFGALVHGDRSFSNRSMVEPKGKPASSGVAADRREVRRLRKPASW